MFLLLLSLPLVSYFVKGSVGQNMSENKSSGYNAGVDDTGICKNYTSLDDEWRLMGSVAGDNCDISLKQGWYRFYNKDGGNSELPTVCIKTKSCGVTIPLRVDLEDNIMPDKGKMLNANVCGSYTILGRWDCCVLRQETFIYNCGEFYVYYLTPPDRCSVGYCVIDSKINVEKYTAKTGEISDEKNVTPFYDITPNTIVATTTDAPLLCKERQQLCSDGQCYDRSRSCPIGLSSKMETAPSLEKTFTYTFSVIRPTQNIATQTIDMTTSAFKTNDKSQAQATPGLLTSASKAAPNGRPTETFSNKQYRSIGTTVSSSYYSESNTVSLSNDNSVMQNINPYSDSLDALDSSNSENIETKYISHTPSVIVKTSSSSTIESSRSTENDITDMQTSYLFESDLALNTESPLSDSSAPFSMPSSTVPFESSDSLTKTTTDSVLPSESPSPTSIQTFTTVSDQNTTRKIDQQLSDVTASATRTTILSTVQTPDDIESFSTPYSSKDSPQRQCGVTVAFSVRGVYIRGYDFFFLRIRIAFSKMLNKFYKSNRGIYIKGRFYWRKRYYRDAEDKDFEENNVHLWNTTLSDNNATFSATVAVDDIYTDPVIYLPDGVLMALLRQQDVINFLENQLSEFNATLLNSSTSDDVTAVAPPPTTTASNLPEDAITQLILTNFGLFVTVIVIGSFCLVCIAIGMAYMKSKGRCGTLRKKSGQYYVKCERALLGDVVRGVIQIENPMSDREILKGEMTETPEREQPSECRNSNENPRQTVEHNLPQDDKSWVVPITEMVENETKADTKL